MTELAVRCIDEKVSLPGRGERAARFVDDYLASRPGLTLGELAFKLRADKRDLQRLLRDRSIGHALEDALAAYFGPIFGEAIFPFWSQGPSRREKELELERAQLAARRERLERLRAADREAAADARDRRRMGTDQDRSACV